MIRLIAFDLDGVLVDACDWHYEALNMALDKVAGYTISRKDHENKFNGLPTATKLNILVKDGIIKEKDKKKISLYKQSFTLDIINQKATYDWDKVALHEKLWSMRIKLCCVTNSIRQTAELMLEKTGQLPYMEFLVTNEDIGKHKPDPAPYYYTVFNANTTMSQTLIVEDSQIGLKAAYASGAHVLEAKDAQDVTIKKVLSKIEEINNRIFEDKSNPNLFGI